MSGADFLSAPGHGTDHSTGNIFPSNHLRAGAPDAIIEPMSETFLS